MVAGGLLGAVGAYVFQVYGGRVLGPEAFPPKPFLAKLEQYGNLTRAAIELAKDWRTDRRLRRLEALLCVADTDASFIISGNGDVIEPEDDIMAIGSGGAFAQSAARALLQNTELDARTIVEKALQIAADICIYTNRNLTIEELK